MNTKPIINNQDTFIVHHPLPDRHDGLQESRQLLAVVEDVHQLDGGDREARGRVRQLRRHELQRQEAQVVQPHEVQQPHGGRHLDGLQLRHHGQVQEAHHRGDEQAHRQVREHGLVQHGLGVLQGEDRRAREGRDGLEVPRRQHPHLPAGRVHPGHVLDHEPLLERPVLRRRPVQEHRLLPAQVVLVDAGEGQGRGQVLLGEDGQGRHQGHHQGVPGGVLRELRQRLLLPLVEGRHQLPPVGHEHRVHHGGLGRVREAVEGLVHLVFFILMFVLAWYLLFKAEEKEFLNKFYWFFILAAMYKACMMLLKEWDNTKIHKKESLM